MPQMPLRFPPPRMEGRRAVGQADFTASGAERPPHRPPPLRFRDRLSRQSPVTGQAPDVPPDRARTPHGGGPPNPSPDPHETGLRRAAPPVQPPFRSVRAVPTGRRVKFSSLPAFRVGMISVILESIHARKTGRPFHVPEHVGDRLSFRRGDAGKTSFRASAARPPARSTAARNHIPDAAPAPHPENGNAQRARRRRRARPSWKEDRPLRRKTERSGFPPRGAVPVRGLEKCRKEAHP